MSLLQRIKRIWALSAIDVPVNNAMTISGVGTTVSKTSEVPPQKARILRRETPLDKFLKDNKE